MTPEDRQLMRILRRERVAKGLFRVRMRWREWLKYRSDRDFCLFAAGASFMAMLSIMTVKRMRRFWNDRYGRDIWYGE